MSNILTKISIVILSGILLSLAANFGYQYYNTKIATPNIELINGIKNKYAPQFKVILQDYDQKLNLLVQEAEKEYYNLPPNEPKSALISVYLKKLNNLDRNSDKQFNSVFENYKRELRKNRLPIDPAWVEQHKYQAFKTEKKSSLYKKYKSKTPKL